MRASAMACRGVLPSPREPARTFCLRSAMKVPWKAAWLATALFHRSTVIFAASECGIGASLKPLGHHELRRCAFNCSKVDYAASKCRNGATLARSPGELEPYSNVSADAFPPINLRPPLTCSATLRMRHTRCIQPSPSPAQPRQSSPERSASGLGLRLERCRGGEGLYGDRIARVAMFAPASEDQHESRFALSNGSNGIVTQSS